MRDHQKHQTQPMQSVTNPENPMEIRYRHHRLYNEGHKETKSEPFPVRESRGVPAHVKTISSLNNESQHQRQEYIHRKKNHNQISAHIYINTYTYTNTYQIYTQAINSKGMQSEVVRK